MIFANSQHRRMRLSLSDSEVVLCVCVRARLRAFFCLLNPHFICNLYIYIQQFGVKVGCYGLEEGHSLLPFRSLSLVGE
jgi:hypothetical protein